jgi:hypothetical protein
MAFIVEQQAQFSVYIQQLRESQAQTDQVVAQTAYMELMMRLSNQPLSINTWPAWITLKFRSWRTRDTQPSGMMRQASTSACGLFPKVCRPPRALRDELL